MKDPNEMTESEHKTIRNLRERGFAVIVWTPEELDGVDRRGVEERSVELGWNVIDDLRVYAALENDKAE